MDTHQHLTQLVDTIYSADNPTQNKSNYQFVNSMDPSVFAQLGSILAKLEGDDLRLACQHLRTEFNRNLQCDHEYGHWGLGLAGTDKINAALTNDPDCSNEKVFEIMGSLLGQHAPRKVVARNP